MADPVLISEVRQLIWDLPLTVTAEAVAIADGRRTTFQLGSYPVIEGSLTVWLDGVDVTEDVTFDPLLGLITASAAPDKGALIEADYQWAQLSDAAIASQLAAHDNNVLLAAARALEVLLLDPVAVSNLHIEGVGLDLNGRRETVSRAIASYREMGSYQRLQLRVDEPDWRMG